MCVMQVVSTQMCNSGRTLCNSTAALIGPSAAVVEVKNLGTLSAWFTHTLDNCTHPIIPVPQAELLLDPDDPTEVVFEVLLTATSVPACCRVVFCCSVHASPSGTHRQVAVCINVVSTPSAPGVPPCVALYDLGEACKPVCNLLVRSYFSSAC